VGILVQTNFGGILQISGVPVGVRLGQYYLQKEAESGSEGSCMIVVATDAPLDSRNLKRLARRALAGIVRTGGFYANSSGDYAIAFSTAKEVRIPDRSSSLTQPVVLLRNEHMSPLFLAAAEASEEAILNSLFKAQRMEGKDGHVAEALPLDRIKELFKERNTP
jgi:D-aminopeptidase